MRIAEQQSALKKKNKSIHRRNICRINFSSPARVYNGNSPDGLLKVSGVPATGGAGLWFFALSILLITHQTFKIEKAHCKGRADLHNSPGSEKKK
jgi:hypothetical protein